MTCLRMPLNPGAPFAYEQMPTAVSENSARTGPREECTNCLSSGLRIGAEGEESMARELEDKNERTPPLILAATKPCCTEVFSSAVDDRDRRSATRIKCNDPKDDHVL